MRPPRRMSGGGSHPTNPRHAHAVEMGIAFVALSRALANATKALAITEAIPGLSLLACAIWHRRIEPVGAIAFAGFGIALLVTIASGGSARPKRHPRSSLASTRLHVTRSRS